MNLYKLLILYNFIIKNQQNIRKTQTKLMTLFNKDTRNKRTRGTLLYNFSTGKELMKRTNRLKQRATSAQENLTDIQVMHENEDMSYLDIRHDYNKILETTERKINKIAHKMVNKNQQQQGPKVTKCNRQQRLKNHLDHELSVLIA